MIKLTGAIRGCVIASLVIVLSANITLFSQVNNKIAGLTRRSDLIIVGKVKEVHSEWNKNKTRIYSRITLKVDQLVKGNSPGNQVSFLQPGGEVGTVGEAYSDIPRFRDDENVLLFLEKTKYGANYMVTGGIGGKFPVQVNSRNEHKTVGGINLNFIIDQIKKAKLMH